MAAAPPHICENILPLFEMRQDVFRAYSSRRLVPARKHIAIAKVKRLGNPHKVGEVKARNFVLVQRIIKEIIQFPFR